MNMAASTNTRRTLQKIAGVTPVGLIAQAFAPKKWDALFGLGETPQVPETELPETLTEALLRKKRLMLLAQKQAAGSAPFGGLESPGQGVQSVQGPTGQAGSILGGPLRRLR